MQGGLILRVVHIAGTRMIESVIDRLSRKNNLGGITRGINPLHFFLSDQVTVEISTGVEPCIRLWWGKRLFRMIVIYWFKKKVHNLLWSPSTKSEETSL